MATRTITTRIAVDGETEFKRAMTGVNAELRTLKSELALTDAQFRGQANSLEYLTKKQDILGRQYDVQQAKTKALEQAVKDATDAWGENDKRTQDYQRQLNQANVELINLRDALKQNEQYLREAAHSADHTADSIDELGNEVEDTDDALEDAGGSALKFGDILKAHLASGAILGAIKRLAAAVWDFAKSSIEAGKEFNKAMSQVAATMGVPVRQIKELRDFAKEMGATTAFSAVQAAEGLNVLAMAGLSARDQMAALPEVLNLAAAGNLSLESSAAYVTGAIKGFKDEMSNAQQYTDLIAKGATLANTSVTGLGDALSRSAATANGYKQNAQSLTLSLLRLAEQNLEGEAASTALNRAMSDLYTPTAAAQKVLDELGFSAYTEAGAARDFNEVIDDLNRSLEGMTDAQRNANLAAIFTTQGLNAFNKMISASPEKLDAFRAGLDSAFGSSAQQAATQLDNLAGDLTLLDSAMEGLKIKISDDLDPVLRGLAQTATALASALSASGEEVPLLTAGVDELLETTRRSAEAYAASTASIQKQADSIRSMIDSLDALNGMSLRTSAQEQAMLDIVQQLNDAIPGLNLSYDAQANSLNMTAEAVRELAAAQEEQLMQVPDLQRQQELAREHGQIVRDLAAAEAQLAAARKAQSAAAGDDLTELAALDNAVTAAADAVWKLTKALEENEASGLRKKGKFQELEDSVEEVGDAFVETAQSAEDLTTAYEEAKEGTEALTGAADLLKTALDEQAESGNVSLDTALKIIDAGYGAALAIDTETGAVTLNKDEYVRLTRAKLDDQIASLETQRQSIQNANNLDIEAVAAEHAGSAYWEAAASKAAMNSGGDTTALEAQIASLKRLRDSLGSYTGAVKSSSRASSSAAKTAEKVKTQAEQDLESYKSMTAELDHLRNVDLVSEREYYQALWGLRDQYLTDDSSVDEYRKVTEKLYSYDKDLADQREELYKDISDLEQEYQEELDKRAQEIFSTYKLFDEVPKQQKKSGQELINNLRNQISSIEGFYSGLSELSARGVGEDLVEEIRKMGPSAASELNALLSLNDSKLTEYADLYKEKQQLANDLALEELDGLRQDTNAKIEENINDLIDLYELSMPDVGAAFSDGLADSILAGMPEVTEAAYSVAQQALEAAMSALNTGYTDIAPGMQRGFSWQSVADRTAANTVNGMSTIMAGMETGDVTLPIYLDSRKVGEGILPGIRSAGRANPEVKDDV